MRSAKWIQSPCKDCPDRHLKCHATCERFLEYRKKYQEERKRIFEEDSIEKAIRGLNYTSASKHEKTAPPLKHGRLRKK